MTASSMPRPGRSTLRRSTDTANARLKDAYSRWVAWGLIIAAAAHFGLIEFFPKLNAADVSRTADPSEVIELPPEVRIPPPPERIAAPATPVPADVPVDPELTIPITEIERPGTVMPPPPSEAGTGKIIFVPRTVNPSVTNTAEILQLLERRYPAILKDAGIEGKVVLWVKVSAQGEPLTARVKESSGQPAFDRIAQEVIMQAEFSPAYNRDTPVAVWVAQPIYFRRGD